MHSKKVKVFHGDTEKDVKHTGHKRFFLRALCDSVVKSVFFEIINLELYIGSLSY
jgi:hypothetical protein